MENHSHGSLSLNGNSSDKYQCKVKGQPSAKLPAAGSTGFSTLKLLQKITAGLSLMLLIVMAGCSSGPQTKNPRIEISTSKGDIIIELYADKAPKTVAAFLSYVEKGLYKDASFYRILNQDNQPSDAAKAQVIQGGLYRSAKRPELPGIPHETTQATGIRHLDGVISLARTTPGSATTEFFICIGDQSGFDYGGGNNPDGQGYAAFGRVVKGLGVVRKIYNLPESDQYFDPPVPIYNIEKL